MRRHVALAVLCFGLILAAPHGSNSKESAESKESSESSESHEKEGVNVTETGVDSSLTEQNETVAETNETATASRAKREDFWGNAGNSVAQGASQLYSSNIQPAMQQLGQTAQNWGQQAQNGIQQGAQQLGQQAQQWGQQAGNAMSNAWTEVKNGVNQGAQQLQSAWNNGGQTNGQMNILPFTGAPQSDQAQNEYNKMMSNGQGQLTMVSESPKNLWDKFLDVFKG